MNCIYTVNDFGKELFLIKSKEIRIFVTYCLLNAPAYFFTMPSSTSGKFHPEYCLGEGGLVRHVKASVALAVNLFRLEWYNLYADPDLVIAALLLHDIVKKDPVKNETAFEHPLLGAAFVEKMADDFNEEIKLQAKEIARLIRSHMGQWTTNDKCPGVVLPKPIERDEQLVHLCDFLASRKNITMELD